MEEHDQRATGGQPPHANPRGTPTTDEIREAVSETGRAAKEEFNELRDESVREDREALHIAREQAAAYADVQRATAAASVAVVADALRAGARTLGERGRHDLADYSNTAADGVDQLAHWVRDESWSEVWHQAEAYARRQPLVTFGGAVAAGFILARFLKSSADMAEHYPDVAETRPGAQRENLTGEAAREQVHAAKEKVRRVAEAARDAASEEERRE